MRFELRRLAWIGVCAVGLSTAQSVQAQGYYAEVITCESHDGRQRYCDADTRGGVRIVNQLSRTNCIEGRNWGYDRRGIWVTQGCRAEFEVGALRGTGDRRHGGYGRVIVCESNDYRQAYCDVDTRGGVRLVNQLSDSACVEGNTWGADRRGVWVRNGCRGEFEVGGGHEDRGRGLPLGGRGYGEPRVLVCESRDERYRHCPAPVHRNVELARQLSRSACVFNRSWGYDVNGVWVDRGCRGEFVIH